MGKRNVPPPDRDKPRFIPVVSCVSLEDMILEPIGIRKLIDKLEKLSLRYGRTAFLEFDAGYNNISVNVVRKVPKNNT